MSRLVRGALAATLVSLAFGFVAGSSALAGSRGVCNSAYDPAINAADFTNARGRPNPINNPYFPLRPGTTYVYDGEKDGAPQHDNFAVTNGTKTIIGVTTVVVDGSVRSIPAARRLIDGFPADRTARLTVYWAGGRKPVSPERAKAMGMVPAGDPARLIVQPDGTVVLVGDPTPVQRATMTVGRNDVCPCGSGHKFKRCCLWRLRASYR